MREFALLPASAAKDKLSKTQPGERVPSWMLNEEITHRVVEIYRLHLQRYTIDDIRQRFINPQTNLPISRGQVERDIKRAREMRVNLFRENMEDTILEQIEAHRQLIRDYREQLRLIRSPVLNYNEETRQYESVPGTEPMVWTGFESRASLDLLKAISEEESKIEGLMGLAQQKLMAPGSVTPDVAQPRVAIQINSYGSDEESHKPPVTAKRIIDSSSIFIE